jgi:hypothetical protein
MSYLKKGRYLYCCALVTELAFLRWGIHLSARIRVRYRTHRDRSEAPLGNRRTIQF